MDCLVVLERVKWTGKWGSCPALSPGPLPDPLAIIRARRGGGPAIHSDVQGTLTSLVTEGRKMLSWARSRESWCQGDGSTLGSRRGPRGSLHTPSLPPPPSVPSRVKAEGWPQLPKEAFGLQSSAVWGSERRSFLHFFLFYVRLCLAVPALSCGTQDL